MRTRSRIVPAIVVAALAAAAAATPASAEDTVVKASLGEGALTILAPAEASLGTGSAAAGTVLAGTMGEVTVTDARGSLLGWNVTAYTMTNAMTSASGAQIALSAAGPLSLATGTVQASGVSLLAGVSAGAGGNLSSTPVPVAVAVAGAGGGTYTYQPTVTLVVPANTKAGDYSVTMVQTVS